MKTVNKQLENLKKVRTAQKTLQKGTETPRVYRIHDQEYTQDFLSLDQFMRLGKIFATLQAPKINGFWETLQHLYEIGKIQEFFEVILKGPQTDFTTAPAHILARVIKDFFSLNQLFELMEELVSDMGIMQAAEGLLTGMKLSPPSPMETLANTGLSEKK